MRKIKVILILVSVFIQSCISFARAGINIPGKDSVSADFNERLCVFTDRNLYITGEKILFSAVVVKSPSMNEYDWSKIIYAELISSNGIPVSQAKYPVRNRMATGYLLIPQDILTGFYYMKLYTRWMRNFPAGYYTWVRIKIINPFQKDIEKWKKNISETAEFENQMPLNNTPLKIICQTDKSVYGKHEKVNISLAVPFIRYQVRPDIYCITVTSPYATETAEYGINLVPDVERARNYSLNFVPDIRGLSLSGRVIDKNTGNGVYQSHVRISVLGKKTDYSSYISLLDGTFLFALEPFVGTSDMYITADPSENMSLDILVDKEYSNENHSFSNLPFTLDEKERITATGFMLNTQIEKSFIRKIRVEASDTGKNELRYFYGNPVSTIYIDDYIKLPNLDEVIFELIHDVSLIRRNGSYYLRSNNKFTDLEIYKPLIMIDNIPVSDVGAMLRMTPEKIERIEVVDRIYAKGDILFGGILNLISKKGDVAGIDLPKNSYFFNYEGFAKQDTVSFPEYEIQPENTRIADVRNCLYWNPSVSIQQDPVDLSFYTSDKTGQYIILVRGVTDRGTIVEGKCYFSVENKNQTK